MKSVQLADYKRFLPVLLLILAQCRKTETPVEPQPVEPQPPATESRYESFDSLDEAKWEYQLYTFDGNGCNMRKENVSLSNSIVSLKTEVNGEAALPKKYNGGEIADKRFYLYGFYTVRMRSNLCKGTVSAFFLMNQWVPTDWEHKEIDIEFLGQNRGAMQCTNHDFQDGGKTWKSSSQTLALPFDVGADFHEYGILWTPESVSWFADGVRIHTDTQYVPHEPLQIRMNYYAGDVNIAGIRAWLGDVDEACLPSTVDIDWIKRESLEEYAARMRAGG
jgi:beta-glucanase (GH16 family)